MIDGTALVRNVSFTHTTSGFAGINLKCAVNCALLDVQPRMLQCSNVTCVAKISSSGGASIDGVSKIWSRWQRSSLIVRAASERGPLRRRRGPGFAASPSVARGSGLKSPKMSLTLLLGLLVSTFVSWRGVGCLEFAVNLSPHHPCTRPSRTPRTPTSRSGWL